VSTEIKKSTKMLTVDAFVDFADFTGETIDQILGRDNDYNRTTARPKELSTLDLGTLDAASLDQLKQIAQSVKDKVLPESTTKKDLTTPVAGRNNKQERGR
jgi:hypothetical protein